MLLYPLHQYLGVGELSPTVGVWLAEQETNKSFSKVFIILFDQFVIVSLTYKLTNAFKVQASY